jgi:hypothetical protein
VRFVTPTAARKAIGRLDPRHRGSAQHDMQKGIAAGEAVAEEVIALEP